MHTVSIEDMILEDELKKFLCSKEADIELNYSWHDSLKYLIWLGFHITGNGINGDGNGELIFILEHDEYGSLSLVDNTLIKYEGTHEDRLDFLNTHVQIEHILLDIKDKYGVNKLELLDDEESFEMAYLYDYFVYPI